MPAFLVIAGMARAPGLASASHIRAQRIGLRSEASLGPAWARFLSGGLAHWAVTPPPRFPSGLYLIRQNGQIVETPFVDYLFWRRSLDPSRFDLHHPFVGPALGQLVLPVVATSIPTLDPGLENLIPPKLIAPETPEPGTLAIAAALCLGALGWGRRQRRHACKHS